MSIGFITKTSRIHNTFDIRTLQWVFYGFYQPFIKTYKNYALSNELLINFGVKTKRSDEI